ncbi:hypothetical protein, partial [Porphyromonas levii]
KMCTFVTVKEKNTSPLSKNGEYYTAYQSQLLATAIIDFFFHRQEEKQEKTLTFHRKYVPLQVK